MRKKKEIIHVIGKVLKIIIGMICGVSILLLLAVYINIGYMYYKEKQEEKKFSQSPYFTEYNLSWGEFGLMAGRFKLDVEPNLMDELNKEDWPDYTYYTMEATEGTEMVVAAMNYWLFDDRSEEDRGGWEKAEEYGFSAENRITVDWVMTHPKEAVAITREMQFQGENLEKYEWIKEIYEKTTGKSVEDATEELESVTEQPEFTTEQPESTTEQPESTTEEPELTTEQ